MLTPITNLYDLAFPIHISRSIQEHMIQELYLGENNTKYLVANHKHYAYDKILEDESTYLGRLLYLNFAEDKNIIPLRFTFTDIAQLCWSKPSIPPDALVIDSRGKLFKTAPLYARTSNRRLLEKFDNYIYVANYPPPIKIPEFSFLMEILDKYAPVVQTVVYKHTLYFRNVAGNKYSNLKVRLL